MSIISILKDFIDLIFPRICEACETGLVGNETIICTRCRISLPRVGTDGLSSSTLLHKFVSMPEIETTQCFLLFTKKGKVQKLLHALKYKGKKEVGLQLGQMFGQEMIASGTLPAAGLIISVPLHQRRKNARGYNQSDLLAEGLSSATGIPWTGTALSRIRHTATQTGKSKIERRENVRNVFRIKEEISPKSIILIDDVLTTGATIEECANTLKAAGCTRFHVVTIALAQH